MPLFSPWLLLLSKVFYSEVGSDKSLRERSHNVPVGQDTLITVSISIKASECLGPQGNTNRLLDCYMYFNVCNNNKGFALAFSSVSYVHYSGDIPLSLERQAFDARVHPRHTSAVPE